MPNRMRIGFHNPFEGAVGGGDRYLFTMLEEAAAGGARTVVLSPAAPDPGALARVGIALPAGVEWERTLGTELTARSAGLDLLVALATDVPVASAARRSVAVVQFPFRARERALERGRAAVLDALGRRRAPHALATYQRFLCYSGFAREWVRRRLGVDAEVLAPPVDPPATPPAPERRPWIVSVGRFFRGAHEKRQDVLIDAFRALDSAGWELHLAGTVDGSARTRDWVEALRARATGLPVHFHLDAPRAEILELYAGASLFWHAAGFGVDASRHPERLEHFGIATVEAMAHGAVPLVVPAGGQAEIVADDRTGRHWRTVAELVSRTRSLMVSPADLSRLRDAARAEAEKYETTGFRRAVRDRVLSLADEPARHVTSPPA